MFAVEPYEVSGKDKEAFLRKLRTANRGFGEGLSQSAAGISTRFNVFSK
jgi:hypothetical protein